MRRRWPLDLRTRPHARPSTHRRPIPPAGTRRAAPRPRRASRPVRAAPPLRVLTPRAHARLPDASPTLADRRRRLRGPLLPRLRRHGACIQTSPTHTALTRRKPDRASLCLCVQTSEPFEVSDDNESLQMVQPHAQAPAWRFSLSPHRTDRSGLRVAAHAQQPDRRVLYHGPSSDPAQGRGRHAHLRHHDLRHALDALEPHACVAHAEP